MADDGGRFRFRPPPGGFKPGVSVETFARQGNMLPDPLVHGSSEAEVMRAIMAIVLPCVLCPAALLALSCLAARSARRFTRRATALARALAAAPADADAERAARAHAFFRPEAVELCFDKMSYWPPPRRRWARGEAAAPPILCGVSGVFRSGAVTAIMGPSGSGKTTLLNLLSARAKGGEFEGVRRLNGKAYAAEAYERAMRAQGYVLQEDAFFECLTVQQQALFACALRMPHALPLEDRMRCVHAVMAEMELLPLGETRIGGGSFKGISGGQRRRLSVAIELLGEPSILFLDEPTSGLDGKSSLGLVSLLTRVAARGRTLATTIHQPRAEIMSLFSSLLLLAVGGHVAFFGAPAEAVAFVSRAQCGRCAPSDNPGDFLIDAIGLDPDAEHAGAASSSLAAQFVGSAAHAALEAALAAARGGEEDGAARASFRPQTTVWQQTWVLLARRAARVPASAALLELLQVASVATALSLAFAHSASGDVYSKPLRDMEWLLCSLTYICVQQYMGILPELFEERPILLKEHEGGGVRLSAYVLYTALADVPRAVTHVALVFLIGYPWVGLNPVPPHKHFILATAWLGTSAFQSLVCAAAFLSDRSGAVYAALFLVAGMGSLFGGLMVSWNNIIGALRWCYYASLNGFMVRAIVLVNSLSNPYYQHQCAELLNSSLGVMAQMPQLNLLAHSVDVHPACAAVIDSINSSRVVEDEAQLDGATASPEDTLVDLGPMALAMYGFNDAFTATTTVILASSIFVFRLLALALAVGRARLSNRLIERRQPSEHFLRRRPARVEQTQLLSCEFRSDDHDEEASRVAPIPRGARQLECGIGVEMAEIPAVPMRTSDL